MRNTSSSGTSTGKTISGRAQLLLAGLLALAVAATALTLYVMAAKPATPASGNNADQAAAVTGPATKVDTLSFQREQKERDEAAFAATWAEYSAPKQAVVTSPKAVKVAAGVGCGADCVVSTWPDGTVVSSDLTSLLDYAAICGCSIVMQPR